MKPLKEHKRWRNSICAKITYASFERAMKSSKRIIGKGDDESLDVYLCRRCGRYHLGHSRDWKELQTTIISQTTIEQIWKSNYI